MRMFREQHIQTASSSSSGGGRPGQLKAKQSQEPGCWLLVPRAWMCVPGASGRGFLLYPGPQWIHLLRRYHAKPLSVEDRTQSCLHVPSNSFKYLQTCTQSAIEGRQAGLSLRVKEYSPVFPPSLDVLRLTEWAEWCVDDKNIYQEKRHQCCNFCWLFSEWAISSLQNLISTQLHRYEESVLYISDSFVFTYFSFLFGLVAFSTLSNSHWPSSCAAFTNW